MDLSRDLTDEDFDRLIVGDDLLTEAAMNEWRSLLREVREAYSTPLSRASESRHIAAILETVPQVIPKPKTARSRSALGGPRATIWKRFRLPPMRRLVLANLMGSLVGKVMIVATAAAATTTGLAVTGSLPEPILSVVTDSADSAGATTANPSHVTSPPSPRATEPSKDPLGEPPAPEPVLVAVPPAHDSLVGTAPEQQASPPVASGKQSEEARRAANPWFFGSGTGPSQTNDSATEPSPSPPDDSDQSWDWDWDGSWDGSWSWSDWEAYSTRPKNSQTASSPGSSRESQTYPEYRRP